MCLKSATIRWRVESKDLVFWFSDPGNSWCVIQMQKSLRVWWNRRFHDSCSGTESGTEPSRRWVPECICISEVINRSSGSSRWPSHGLTSPASDKMWTVYTWWGSWLSVALWDGTGGRSDVTDSDWRLLKETERSLTSGSKQTPVVLQRDNGTLSEGLHDALTLCSALMWSSRRSVPLY